LLPSTTYYVCAYATNSTGTGYGSVVSFTTKAVAPDVIKTVGKDANSNYNTIQAAFSAVPSNYTGRWIIYVKNGTYIEKDELTSTKPNVYLIGQNVDSCIITYNNYAGIPSASGGTIGTTNSYSVAIDASDFYAQNITFQNTIENTGKNTFSSGGDQAVALRTEGDRQQYYNCRLLGYQDTYYTNSSGRIYMKDCYIAGSVDFIFGDGTMILDSCTTYCNRSGGINCAPNTLATSSFGYVFRNCTLTSLAAGTLDFTGTAFVNYYLGRPWQNNPKAAYITCSEPATINPLGWATMTSGLNPFFAEYNCTGPGSAFSGRCTTFTSGYDFAGQQLTGTQAATYTTSNIFSKNTNPSFSYNWLPSPMTDIIDTITIIIPTNGTLTVSNGTTQLHSGDVVPTGASLTVTATPNTNYNISTLTANETSISSTYTVAKSTTFNATFNVTSGLETISSGTNQLNQNVPNPVVTSSVISYSIAQDCQVTLTVTNTLGRKIATLVNALKSAGAYSINVNEAMFPTGIYFYTLQAGNFSQTKTMIVR
jgi:pectin methylesterase-like acyl-CoA thioesterase